MDTKGLQKEFISWCKSNNKSPKSEDETKQLFVAFMKEKHPEEYKQAVQNQQKQQQAQAKKAAHGTKLTYFKSLKNQCAEDEEVTYFKKGGSVRCGCKKKEDGGEIAKAQKGSAVDKFKAMKMQKAGKVRTKAELDRINKQSEEDAINGTYGMSQKQIKKFNNPKVTRETYNSMDGDPHGNKIQRVITHREPTTKNDTTYNRTLHSLYGDNRLKFSSSNNGDRKQYKKDEESFNRAKSHSSAIKKDCGGSAIKKFKMHRLGGSLNGIPFMQNGTPKGGIEKSDNTRVNKILDNRERRSYEQVPVDGWDFVPLVSTYKEAKRLDLGDPNASAAGFATSLGFDLFGVGTMGPALKASAKAFRLNKLLKSRGFNKITKPNPFGGPAKEAYMKIDYNTATPTIRFKLVPNVDATGVAVTPFLQTLRVPAQAAAH